MLKDSSCDYHLGRNGMCLCPSSNILQFFKMGKNVEWLWKIPDEIFSKIKIIKALKFEIQFSGARVTFSSLVAIESTSFKFKEKKIHKLTHESFWEKFNIHTESNFKCIEFLWWFENLFLWLLDVQNRRPLLSHIRGHKKSMSRKISIFIRLQFSHIFMTWKTLTILITLQCKNDDDKNRNLSQVGVKRKAKDVRHKLFSLCGQRKKFS